MFLIFIAGHLLPEAMSESTSRKRSDSTPAKKRRCSPVQKSSDSSLVTIAGAYKLKKVQEKLYLNRKLHRDLKDKLDARCESKLEARKRIFALKKHMAEKANDKDSNHKSDSDDDSDPEDRIDSQQSLIEEIICIGKEVKAFEKKIKVLEENEND